jgi:hypothetical protein
MFIPSTISIIALSIFTVDNNLLKKHCELYCEAYKQQSTLEYNYITSEKYFEELILKYQDVMP